MDCALVVAVAVSSPRSEPLDAAATLEGVSGTDDWKAAPIRLRNSCFESPEARYSLSSPFLNNVKVGKTTVGKPRSEIDDNHLLYNHESGRFWYRKYCCKIRSFLGPGNES